MTLEIGLLRSFVVAAETLNFSAAGQQLGTVQSAISAHIRRLEEIAGRTLFERGRGRSMTLTPAGEELLDYAHRILRLSEDALGALQPERPKTALRFGTTETYALTLLPQALSLFTRLHPTVETSVVCARSPDLLSALDGGDLDLIVATDQGRRAGRSLVREEPLVWAASRRFRVSPSQPIPLAFMPAGCEFRAAGLRALDGAGRGNRLVMSSPSPMGVRAALLADIAVTVMPKVSVDEPLRVIGELKGLPPLGTVAIVAYRRPRGLEPALEDLIDQFLSGL